MSGLADRGSCQHHVQGAHTDDERCPLNAGEHGFHAWNSAPVAMRGL